MSHPDLHAALAFERQTMFLAEAEADRLARHARPHQRSRGRALGWLSPVRGRLLTRRPGPGPLVEAYEDV
jgi:hypothetical protein